MEDEQKEFMASILIPHKYSQNQIIKWQDEPTIAFFIIQKVILKHKAKF